jgi:hypothetical protein
MYYTPQPLAIHSLMERQNFRRGACTAYENVILYDAPNFKMPNVVIKREVSGVAPVVYLVDLEDNDITTLTPTSAVNWPLDTEEEFEALLLGTGSWAGAVSVQIETKYYLRIECGAEVYYSDEFLLDDDIDGFPPDCGENWAKFTWTLDGTCIVSGRTTANPGEAVHAYPQTPFAFFTYWKANISRPEWDQEDFVAEPDAHGIEVRDGVRLIKRWTLEGVPVSESIADALTTSTLSDLVWIQFRDGDVLSGIKDIKTDISWENGGCDAVATVTFSTDYFVKQGCC